MMRCLVFVAYLLIGGITARRVFVSYVNEHGRNAVRDKDSYGRPVGEARDPFAMPFWAGVFWPILLPLAGIGWLWEHTIEAPTPQERRQRKRQELERTAADVRAIGERYDLPVEGYISDAEISVRIDR